MPEFPIIDSHVHLYDVNRLSYGWLANVPKIDRSFDLADFDAARGPVDVEKLVFAEVAVDPGLHIDEAEFIQHMADADPRLAASVAGAAMLGLVAGGLLPTGTTQEMSAVELLAMTNAYTPLDAR